MPEHDEMDCPNCQECPSCQGDTDGPTNVRIIRLSPSVIAMECTDCDGKGLICSCECHEEPTDG